MKLFSLSKYERIKEKKKIQQLIKEGSSVFSSKNTLRAIYLILDKSLGKKEFNAGIKIAVGISKKAGSATWRNRLKRLIKNAYRLNKQELLKTSIENNKSLLILFTAINLNQKNNRKLSFGEINSEVISLLNKISDKIKIR